MSNTNEQLITAGFMSKFAEKCKNAFRPKILKSEDLINPYLLIITDILYNNEDNEVHKLLFHITNSDLETVNSYITFQAENNEGKQLIDLAVHNFGYISPVASGVYDNKLALLIKIQGNVACDVISESQNVINSEYWVVKFVDVEIQDNLLLIESKSFDIFKIYNINKDFLLDFEHEIDTTSFYTQIKKGDKVFEYLPYMHTEVEEKDVTPTEVLFGEGKIEGIYKSNISDATKKFSSEKTISFPDRENTFIITGPAVTSNFENEIVLPTIEFSGVKVVDDQDAELPSRGGWYNEVYIKPGNKGLVTKVRKTSLNPENSALPYVNTENLDQLYFRIDDRKSITEEIPIYQSISQIFKCVINEVEIQDGTFVTNISASDKQICIFYNEYGSPIPLSYSYDPITSDTASNASIICGTGEQGKRVIELKKDNEIVASITFTNIASTTGMTTNDSSMTFIYIPPETNEYDGEIEYNGEVYKYKWTTLPSYSGVIGTCENLTLLQIDLSNASLSEVYVNLYKQLTGQDDLVALSDKKIIVLGNDGLLIKKGTKEFKFQI